MPLDDERFEQVELDSLSPNPCTPAPPGPDFRGLLVAAPSRVTFREGQMVGDQGAFARIPVCGVYVLDLPFRTRTGSVLDSIKLVAVNVETRGTFSGYLIDRNPIVPPPADLPVPNKAECVGMSVRGYFNPNAAEQVALPPAAGVYELHIELEPLRSNTVRVEVVEARE